MVGVLWSYILLLEETGVPGINCLPWTGEHDELEIEPVVTKMGFIPVSSRLNVVIYEHMYI